jgi:transcription elongation GreA/GreB family factor
MKEEFDKLLAAGKINRNHVDALVQLAKTGYCLHRSWGFGRITTVDTVFARFTIDFPNKPGHTMDLSFAAESLKPIASEHILARKAADLEGLRQMAALHHLDLIKLVLESYGGKATLEQIQQVLVPDVIRDDWKKWWEVARKEMKKDGHFVIPTRKSDPITYQAKEVSLEDRLVGDFRAAKGLKAKITAANEALKSLPDVANKEAVGQELVKALNSVIVSHQRTQPAVALEGIFMREDIRAAVGSQPQAGEVSANDIWNQEQMRFAPIIEQVPSAKHKRTLQSFQEAFLGTWHNVVLNSLNQLSMRVVGECVELLVATGKLNELKAALARVISQHQASSELLAWLGKERSDAFADILGPEVFRAMLTAMERDQFNEKRSNRLHNLIIEDQQLIVDLIGAADIEVIKDLVRALQLSPCFDDMDKRSLLARVVKSDPAVQAIISGEQTKQEAPLFVSWDSLERRRNEYAELVQKKLPANSHEIAIARSYGDLRENHEYKAAKEMQKILLRRKAELEVMLLRARGTDFANPRTDVVSLGTRIRVRDLEQPHDETFAILGAWDYDPEHGAISYQSPMAQALLNRKPGEEVEFEMEGTRRRVRIDAIEPYRAPEAAPTAAGPSSAPIQPQA